MQEKDERTHVRQVAGQHGYNSDFPTLSVMARLYGGAKACQGIPYTVATVFSRVSPSFEIHWVNFLVIVFPASPLSEISPLFPSSSNRSFLPQFHHSVVYRITSLSSFMIHPLGKYLKSEKKTLSLLQQCHLTMIHIKQILGHLVVSATLSDPFAAGKIIAFCAVSDRGDLDYAYLIFRHLPHRSTFIWNTMIRAFAEKDQPTRALSLYRQMLQSGFLPNNYTFSFSLRSCGDLSALLDGQKLHAQIIRLGWESYDFVLNGLIDMYVNCNCISSARALFDKSSSLDVVSWTAMVNGFAKSGEVELARQLFNQMPDRNAVSWSAMINCYAQAGLFGEALELFKEIQLVGCQPNHAGLVGALTACAVLGALEQGRWIHAYANKNRMKLDRILGTALIDMYAKCGCIETSWQVFNTMPERDVFAWTSMISGLANHGHSESAIKLFMRMQKERIRPNEITFIGLLSACSRSGMVKEGRGFFESMTVDYGIEPGVQHYGCLVDLLGRAGMLEEAEKVVREMPLEPDSYVLGALLNACRVHGEVELGKKTVDSLVGLQLDHGGVHVLLSNMYASNNRWKDVAKVRKGMEEMKVKKVPGCSLIEFDGVVVEFVAGDRSHLLIDEMILLLLGMDKQLKSVEQDIEASGFSILQKLLREFTFSSSLIAGLEDARGLFHRSSKPVKLISMLLQSDRTQKRKRALSFRSHFSESLFRSLALRKGNGDHQQRGEILFFKQSLCTISLLHADAIPFSVVLFADKNRRGRNFLFGISASRCSIFSLPMSTALIFPGTARIIRRKSLCLGTPHLRSVPAGSRCPRGNSGDTGKLSNQEVTTREGRYKILLVYARRHTEKLVMEILPEVVSSVTPEEARRLFHESRNECTALVIVAVKEQAEFYVETMVEKGLRAAMEPESLPG
ncbi:hypothetical protein ACLOJK_014437 [Asimina triloba]